MRFVETIFHPSFGWRLLELICLDAQCMELIGVRLEWVWSPFCLGAPRGSFGPDGPRDPRGDALVDTSLWGMPSAASSGWLNYGLDGSQKAAGREGGPLQE